METAITLCSLHNDQTWKCRNKSKFEKVNFLFKKKNIFGIDVERLILGLWEFSLLYKCHLYPAIFNFKTVCFIKYFLNNLIQTILIEETIGEIFSKWETFFASFNWYDIRKESYKHFATDGLNNMVYTVKRTVMFPTHTRIDVHLRKVEDFLFGIKNEKQKWEAGDS